MNAARGMAAMAVLAALAGLSGCAAPNDGEVAEIGVCGPVAASAATATLRLRELSDRPRHVCLHAPPHRLFVQEVSVWRDEAGGDPRAAISVQRLAPGYHFLLERDLRQQTADLGVAHGAVSYGAVATARNGVGTIRYLTFDTGTLACVAFSQYWGNTDMETTVSVGRARVFGYYCDGAPVAAPSSDVVAALAIDPNDPAGTAAPAAAPAVPGDAARARDQFMRVALQPPRRAGHF